MPRLSLVLPFALVCLSLAGSDQPGLVESAAAQQLKRYCDRPYPVGPIRFRFLGDQDLDRSLFAPEADLGIMLEYPSAGVTLRAHGLYFRPRPGQLPEPVFDRMQIDSKGLDTLLERKLTRLGEALPELGLPLIVRSPRFNGFSPDNGKAPGSISFKLVLGLGDLLDIRPIDALRLEMGVTLHTDGRIDLEDGLKATIAEPLPLGATGLILDGCTVMLQPCQKKETVIIETCLAPAAGGKNGIALDIRLSLDLPLKKGQVRFEGDLVLGRQQKLGRVAGTLSSQDLRGMLLIPHPQAPLPGGDLLTVRADFELNGQGLNADAMASVFRSYEQSMKLILACGGEGSLEIEKQVRLFGLDAEASLDVSFSPGFRQLTLEGMLAIEVDLLVRKTYASVAITASSTSRPAVTVTAKALGVTVQLTADDLRELQTPHLLERELSRKLGPIYDNLLDALAELDLFNGRLLARAEHRLRERTREAFQRVGREGLRARLGYQDERLCQLCECHCNLLDWGTHTRGRYHPESWAEERHRLGQPTLLDKLVSAFRELASILDLSPHDKRQGEAIRCQRLVDARLETLVSAINRAPPQCRKACRAGKTTCPHSCLHLNFEDAVSSWAGDKDRDSGVLAFTILASGYSKKAGNSCHDSDIKMGRVHFIDLLNPEAQPRARIVIPKLAHGSDWPAERVAFETIAALIEEHLPEVIIEGRPGE